MILEQLKALEKHVAYYTPPPGGLLPFAHTAGHLPILLSAPHGTAHKRNGRFKEEDEYTTAFVRLIANRTGAHALYACYQSDTDPNWDERAPYKDYLRGLIAQHDIHFVLDIHGMSNRHNIGLALGTINGRSCPDHERHIISLLETTAFKKTTQHQAQLFPNLYWDRFVVNHSKFTGGVTNYTVTRFVSQELGIPAAQFELCSSVRVVERTLSGQAPKWLRPFYGDPQGIEKTVQTFIGLVNSLSPHEKAFKNPV